MLILLYPVKPVMKICQKYGKNIKVKHKIEEKEGEKMGVMPGKEK